MQEDIIALVQEEEDEEGDVPSISGQLVNVLVVSQVLEIQNVRNDYPKNCKKIYRTI